MSDQMPIFNSQNEQYKKPFGALKAGEPAFFALHVPKGYGCGEPRMFLQKDGEAAVEYRMEKNSAEGGGDAGGETDVFTIRLCLPDVGLYFYWFDLWVNYRKLFRGQMGRAVETTGTGDAWQLTVYAADFTTPSEMHGAVMYQIFPDRFYEGNSGKPHIYNERVYRANKDGEPYFWPIEEESGFLTQDYYGGDFAGIKARLRYLRGLGVSYIYLNPIAEAHANHRYNTADYLNADPYLGTNEDFTELCDEAASYGIRIILDGVFSHTGSDSIYFNREGRYPTHGAWQGADSPYRGWYHFHPDGTYDSWWGFDTLPACNKDDPGLCAFICGAGGVIDTWMKRGAAGYRLDVADELPDSFIADIRAAVKRHGDDKLLIGEVWEDASHKMAYGVRRRYFLGGELDGVMNYVFRTAILKFLGGYGAQEFADTVMQTVENYPAPAMAACTTHISTHDTERAITALAGEPLGHHDRSWQSGRRLTPAQWETGMAKMRLAFVLQFTLPGVPCVYYGDEIPMQGYKDPFNRAYFNWHAPESGLGRLVADLARLRRESPAFKESGIRFLRAEDGVLVFERFGVNGSRAVVAVNGSREAITVELPAGSVDVLPMGYAFGHD